MSQYYNYQLSYFFRILFVTVIIGKEVIPFNEEMLLISAFFTFIWLTINAISSIIKQSMDDRSEQISVVFRDFLITKQSSLSSQIALQNLTKFEQNIFKYFVTVVFVQQFSYSSNFYNHPIQLLNNLVMFDLNSILSLEVATMKKYYIYKITKAI